MYVKLFSDLLHSSIWTEDSDTRIVWITLLLMANEDGFVSATAPGIAHTASVPLEATLAALQKFEEPDPYSRTERNEGRRIEKVEGGYLITNYAKYRSLKTRAEEREAVRRRVAAHRARKRAEQEEQADVTECNASVTPCNASVTESNPIQKQKQKQKQRQKKGRNGACTEPENGPVSVPSILKGLELYETDKRLCERLTPKVLHAWEVAYPGVDIAQQIAKAHAWEVANPKRRKRDRIRFLGAWLARAQDRAPANGADEDSPYPDI